MGHPIGPKWPIFFLPQGSPNNMSDADLPFGVKLQGFQNGPPFWATLAQKMVHFLKTLISTQNGKNASDVLLGQPWSKNKKWATVAQIEAKFFNNNLGLVKTLAKHQGTSLDAFGKRKKWATFGQNLTPKF